MSTEYEYILESFLMEAEEQFEEFRGSFSACVKEATRLQKKYPESEFKILELSLFKDEHGIDDDDELPPRGDSQ